MSPSKVLRGNWASVVRPAQDFNYHFLVLVFCDDAVSSQHYRGRYKEGVVPAIQVNGVHLVLIIGGVVKWLS